MDPPTRVVIDTDPGIDDAVALALAARSPEIEIVAVTTTYGNASLRATSRNAAHVLALAGRHDVPVRPGAARPLRRVASDGQRRHGPDGIGDAVVPRAPSVTEHPSVLLDVLSPLDRPVTLVTLGPLTNLARAITLDGALVAARVERHLAVFGNPSPETDRGPQADFNAWADPEAAAAVLQSGLETVMVGLDVTNRVRVAGDLVRRIAASTDPLAAWLGAALRFRLATALQRTGADDCAVHDVVPVGALIEPELLTLAQLPLSVDLGDGERRGRTLRAERGRPTHVVVDVDVAGTVKLLERVWK